MESSSFRDPWSVERQKRLRKKFHGHPFVLEWFQVLLLNWLFLWQHLWWGHIIDLGNAITGSEMSCLFKISKATMGCWGKGQGNTKGGSIPVPLTSCLTGLESAVWLLTIYVFIWKTDLSKPVKQEVNGTVILFPLVLFPLRALPVSVQHSLFLFLLLVWRAEFPQKFRSNRLGPHLSPLGRIRCACWPSSLVES